MGGFLGIGQSGSDKTDRSAMRTGFGDLNSVFNFGLSQGQSGAATGQATTQAGVTGIGNAMSYWQKLLSGNRAAQMGAIAPVTNTVLSQADATKRQQASSGTARGGGTAGANQQTGDTAMSKIDNALLGVQGSAATSEAEAGGKLASIGTSEVANANNALGIGENAAS